MAMRITGMNSGLDTEGIIKELVQVKQINVDKMKKAQTKLEWKQDIWKSLNSKIFSFHRNALSELRYQGSFTKKMTTISDSNIATILTSDSAMNSVQSLKVKEIAQSGYMTGKEIFKADGSNIDADTKITDLGIAKGSSFELTVAGKTTEFTIDEDTTIKSLVADLKEAGVGANFDTKTNRFFIGSTESGEKNDFSLTATTDNGVNVLSKLGILSYDTSSEKVYKEYANMATNAEAKNAKLEELILSEAARLAKERDTINTSINDKEKDIADLKKDYQEMYGSDSEYGNFDKLANNTDGTLDKLQKRIELLEAKDDITEDDKKELRNLKGIKSYVDGYEKHKASLDDLNTELTEVNSLINEDGTARDVLKNDITDKLNDKIDASQKVLDDWAANVGKTNAVKNVGTDSEIFLNGQRFTSSTNTFEINGLTITCNNKTEGDSVVTLNTQNDTSGIYDMVKKFITGYASLINEMDKLYNADLTKGLEPLTEEEKNAISDKEAEKLEEKIKASVLRRDGNINAVSTAMKEIMASGFSVNGKTMYLSDFGIETLGYFEAEINEKSAYHIHGDADDEKVSNKENKLLAMISTDPDTVMTFFNELSNKLYNKITNLGSTVEGFRSSFTLYDDKKMKSDYSDYTAKIQAAEKKLIAYEDKWYQKFSAMEVAMAKMQSNASAITGLLGGGA